MIEPKRGCGYRKVGGIYLMGSGLSVVCHRLPVALPEACPTCGAGIKFHRGVQIVNGTELLGVLNSCITSPGAAIFECHAFNCKVCFPENKMGLMWVGEKYYTPKSFTLEAQNMGVSKKIACVPRDLVIGETWILLAHLRGATERISIEACTEENVPGIFYAFRPTKIEMLIRKSEAIDENLERLGKRGITPVIVPDDDPDHNPEAGKNQKQNQINIGV